VLDETGQVQLEQRVRTTAKALREVFGALPRSRIALEIGTHSPWISRLLSELGNEVIVANARKVRLIGESRKKDDRLDAQTLARQARIDPELLYPVKHRSVQAQADLTLIRARAGLVRARTGLVNTGADWRRVTHRGIQRAHRESGPAELSAGGAAEADQGRRHTDRADVLADLGRSASLPQEPRRGLHLGLQPGRRNSGQSEPQLHISKEGDPYLRTLLVQGAQHILGPFGVDCDLRRWGLKLAERGGRNGKKRAIVATARKLAVLLHHLWVSGEVYEPLHNSSPTTVAAAA
jgi:transposase